MVVQITSERYNNLSLEPYLDPNISGTEPYRALKMKMSKVKFVKTQHLKEHYPCP